MRKNAVILCEYADGTSLLTGKTRLLFPKSSRRIIHTPLLKHFIPAIRVKVVRWPVRKPEGERGERYCSWSRHDSSRPRRKDSFCWDSERQIVNAGTNHAQPNPRSDLRRERRQRRVK
jgi:hypothetical protein